jgi:hypothetical protein
VLLQTTTNDLAGESDFMAVEFELNGVENGIKGKNENLVMNFAGEAEVWLFHERFCGGSLRGCRDSTEKTKGHCWKKFCRGKIHSHRMLALPRSECGEATGESRHMLYTVSIRQGIVGPHQYCSQPITPGESSITC